MIFNNKIESRAWECESVFPCITSWVLCGGEWGDLWDWWMPVDTRGRRLDVAGGVAASWRWPVDSRSQLPAGDWAKTTYGNHPSLRWDGLAYINPPPSIIDVGCPCRAPPLVGKLDLKPSLGILKLGCQQHLSSGGSTVSYRGIWAAGTF